MIATQNSNDYTTTPGCGDCHPKFFQRLIRYGLTYLGIKVNVYSVEDFRSELILTEFISFSHSIHHKCK